MPYKNKEDSYKWLKARRMEWINSHGPCKHCNSWDNLQVDHIDPSLKKYHASRIWSRKAKIREPELLKCQVLCADCHKKKTISELTLPTEHGTRREYDKGCRCRPCTDAAVDAGNQWRWKTGRRKKHD